MRNETEARTKSFTWPKSHSSFVILASCLFCRCKNGHTGSAEAIFVTGCRIENDFIVLGTAWMQTLSNTAVVVTWCEASQTSKGASCFLKNWDGESGWEGGGVMEERNEWCWRGRLRWHIGSPGVSLCVIGEWWVFICLHRKREDTLRRLQWDFSNYLLLHIWMRWVMRGLEALAALPPSENHLQGDFKNTPIMLQDKSLITGNYGLPMSYSSPFLQMPWLLLSSHSTGGAEGSRDDQGGGEKKWGEAITWQQTVIMASDAFLHFHSCGVAHLWAAITDQIIQTGSCDEEVSGLTEL